MPAQDLVLRIPKGSPDTALEMDTNLLILRNFANALEALFLTAFNSDGGLKNNSVTTNSIVDRTITNDDLAFLFNFYKVDTGAVNALAISFTPALAAYAAGLVFFVRAANSNSGPATLNVNGVGAVAITKNGAVALVTGDILDDAVYILVHDGTNFQVLNPSSTGATPAPVGGGTALVTEEAAGNAGATSVGWNVRGTTTAWTLRQTVTGLYGLAAGGKITFSQNGTYIVTCRSPAYAADNHTTKIVAALNGADITTLTEFIGASSSAPDPSTQTASAVQGILEITNASVGVPFMRLEHNIQNANTDGLGINFFGTTCVFASVEIIKIA